MFTVTKKGLFALPVREGRNAGAFPGAHHVATTFCQRYPCGKEKLFAHTLREDKLAALQMQTTLYGHVMHAKSVAMYRRVHTHTHAQVTPGPVQKKALKRFFNLDAVKRYVHRPQ